MPPRSRSISRKPIGPWKRPISRESEAASITSQTAAKRERREHEAPPVGARERARRRAEVDAHEHHAEQQRRGEPRREPAESVRAPRHDARNPMP